MTVRHVQARRASGSTMRMVMSAKAARKAASCQAVKPHHLMAAPPVEKRTAATTIFERGLMAPRRGSRNIFQTMRFALRSEERRVGKEWRSRRAGYPYREETQTRAQR